MEVQVMYCETMNSECSRKRGISIKIFFQKFWKVRGFIIKNEPLLLPFKAPKYPAYLLCCMEETTTRGYFRREFLM